MKLFALSFLLSLPFVAFSQKLIENTNNEYGPVRRTSWESLAKGILATFQTHVQCTRSNDEIDLGVKLTWVNGTMDQGAALQLTLDDSSVVELYNSKLTLPCVGCGSIGGFIGSGTLGFYLHFPIPPKAANDLSSHKIIKIRFYMHDGYIEEKIKDKLGDTLQKELRLL